MRWVAYAVAAIMLGLIVPPAAFAHDDVVGTSPGNGDQVTQVPDEVRIEFVERPRWGSGSITGPAGQELSRGEARIDGFELVIPMRPVTELGTYAVDFRVTSNDGHSISGTLGLELIQQATQTPTPAEPSPQAATDEDADSESPAADDDGSSAWLWAGLAGGVGVAVVALLVARAASRARSGH